MDKKWIFAGIVFVLLCLVGIAAYVRHLHHKKARARVRSRSDIRKLQEINDALRPFGFSYDLEKDIFYSLKDAWQRKTGYGKLYDEMAPLMNMVIDCEPIYFMYDNRRWLIELWKGQYGITSGAEVGIYVEKEKKGQVPANEVFYQAVSEEEELPLSMTLYRDGKLLFHREKRHWWLTGFCLGMFSEPEDLVLRASVSFPSQGMMKAFLAGCFQAGYRPGDVSVRYNEVTLYVARPKTLQPTLVGKYRRRFIQRQNQWNCNLYLYLTKGFDGNLDRLYYLMMEYPVVFRMITKLGRSGRMSDKAGAGKGRREK